MTQLIVEYANHYLVTKIEVDQTLFFTIVHICSYLNADQTPYVRRALNSMPSSIVITIPNL